MAASQGRASDPPRTNNSIVYVSLTTKTEASNAGYVADIQPRSAPIAQCIPDGAAP